ncbi:hypothetical protein FQA39_LY10118 [Lamprigera yunnana]|nr:hypothetical protein FQA39_LY10118 [Lamprigera yunnana]
MSNNNTSTPSLDGHEDFVEATNFDQKDSLLLPGLLRMKDKICLRIFLAGVLPLYQTLLTIKEPRTYQEASYFCIRIENENKINQSHKKLLKTQNNCSYCKKANHSTANCYKRLNHSINTQHNENTFSKGEARIHNTSFNNSNYQKSSPFCNYCKKTNHVIQDCRKLKWKREKEKSNSVSTSSNVNMISTDKEPLCVVQPPLNSISTVETPADPQSVNLIKAVDSTTSYVSIFSTISSNDYNKLSGYFFN